MEKWFFHISLFLLLVILGFSITNLYYLKIDNLKAEKTLLEEQELFLRLQINDYIDAIKEIEE